MRTGAAVRWSVIAALSVVMLGACTAPSGGESTTSTTSTTTTSTTSTTSTTVPPVLVPGRNLALGNNHSCAIVAGEAKCWGWNAMGQLGDGSTTSSVAPVAVASLLAVDSIVAGDNQTCAITAAGGAWCWGSNASGQLGNGTNANSAVPVQVQGLSTGVSVLAAGDNHVCAGLTAGGVKCWGWGTSGQLGNNAASSSNVPVDVSGISTPVIAMSAGYAHTCAVLSSGEIKCWGRAGAGQLGSGTTVNSRVPLDVVGAGTGGTDVVGGGTHTCAVLSSAALCWGQNSLGQLGNGSTTGSSTPVGVSGATSVRSVAAGAAHSCAVSIGGGVTCWGDNAGGVLGTGSGSPAFSTTSMAVLGLTAGVDEISAGATHTCAASGATVRCWGGNEYGQLGNGTTNSSNRPVQVVGL